MRATKIIYEHFVCNSSYVKSLKGTISVYLYCEIIAMDYFNKPKSSPFPIVI